MAVSTGTVRQHRSLLSLATEVLNARARSQGYRNSRLAAALKSHLLTFCACGLVDVGAFHWSQIAGYMFTGLSLVVIDAKVQEG